MEINVFNNYGECAFDYEAIVLDIENMFFKEMDIENSLSLVLVDLAEIHSLNTKFRNIDAPTDVISFEDEEEEYLGDIFICIDKVIEQAQNYGHSNEREFAFLLTHGVLHLLKYDHQTEEEAKIMFAKQDELLNQTKYKRGWLWINYLMKQ